jgi:hypothetical protein
MKLFKKPKQSTPPLPEQVYVYKEIDGDLSYLVVNETLREAADPADDRLVGVYKLQYMIKTRLEVVSIAVDEITHKMSWGDLIKQLSLQGEKFKKTLLGKGNHHD